ncbi:hypothetical protein Avbf_06491 [Armadillidium vulgare]|nr:hypothetical protein Avbf_06491 [Armadillidium vulgare]
MFILSLILYQYSSDLMFTQNSCCSYKKAKIDVGQTPFRRYCFFGFLDIIQERIDKQGEEKEEKSYLGRVWLRSFDSFSKKMRLNLRSQNLSSLCPSDETDEKESSSSNKDDVTNDRGTLPCRKLLTNSHEYEIESKRDSFHLPENSWLLTAFSSLRRGGSRKKSPPTVVVPNHQEFDFVDLRSPIPTGRDSLGDLPVSADKKNVSSKLDSVSVNRNCYSDSKSFERGHITTKQEVEVKRQLFPNKSVSHPAFHSEISDTKLLNVNKTSLHEVKSMPKLESSWNFPRISAQDSSRDQYLKSPMKDEKKSILTKGLSTPSLKTTTTTTNQSSKNEFQFLRRISLMKDKRMTLNETTTANENNKSLPNEDRHPKIEDDELHYMKTKKKNFIASLKMNCTSRTAVKELILTPTNYEKAPSPMSSSTKVAINFQLQHQTAKSSMADTEIYLPMSDTSKLLLKCLCFTYNVLEHHLSLGCWLILVKGRTLDYLTGMTMNVSTEGNVVASSEEDQIFGFCGEIHPTYFFHWLERIEICANLSSYSQKEEQMIAYSIVDYVQHISQQLKRIHAMFPINQSSHLSFSLRTEALEKEILNEKKFPLTSTTDNGFTNLERHLRENVNPIRQKQIQSLTQGITSGEKALLAINDFIGLGEKLYQAIFEKELDESYLEIIWPNMTSILENSLNPIQASLQGKDLYEMFKEESESLQELHTSLWVVLLQLSKLQRFQTYREKHSSSTFLLPETFFETFFLLCRLWLRFCLIRLEETAMLECQIDNLCPSTNDEGYGSSAAEINDIINVVREKISRFSFPATRKLKDNLALFLEDGIAPVVEKYQHELCCKSLKSTPVVNALTPQMCVAINSIEKVCKESESLISSLCSPPRKSLNGIESFNTQVKKGSFLIFSKCLPNLPTWIENALSGNEKEDYLLDWIKSVLDKLLGDAVPQSNLFALFLHQFWHYIFTIVEDKQKSLNQSKDFRVLENFMKKLHYTFKINLGLTLSQESELAYQNFMEVMKLKASPTSDVIQAYYAERFEEQSTLRSNREPLVINAYFCKEKGLRVNIYMCPFVEASNKEKDFENRSILRFSSLRRRSTLEMGFQHLVSRHFLRDFKVTTQVKRKAASVLESIRHSSGVSFYVKVSAVPSPWFRKISTKRTKSTQRNPPVFEDHLSLSSSVVDSEALLPLKKIPILTPEEKMENKHTFLTLSSPSSVEDYKTLEELVTRTQDKEALSFLTHLEESYWTFKSSEK